MSLAVGLLENARAGDQEAFLRLLEPHLPAAHRLAYGMLRSQADAEDAVQEAVLNLWRHIGRLRPGSELRPWFLTIVANQCRSQRRSRWAAVLKREPPPAPAAPEAFDPARADLRKALARLPHEQCLLLVLRYYLDLPFAEIGGLLGISGKAANARTRRALERLRLLPEVLADD